MPSSLGFGLSLVFLGSSLGEGPPAQNDLIELENGLGFIELENSAGSIELEDGP